jgi:purine-nucleoside/S-methyl-5'-thioadenosine phosphorylase / adenosine deaminase
MRLNQIHGATVLRTGDPAFISGSPDGDALISSEVDEVIAVRTADCLPVLLCSELGEEIAAVHCGWRGLAADILANTIDAMDTPAGDLMAWFGPAISQKAFEVQDDVRDAFVSKDENAAACFEPNECGRYQADLYGLARLKLTRAGVEQVFGGGLCTYSDPETLYSYRRDGSTGRMISFIYKLQARAT